MLNKKWFNFQHSCLIIDIFDILHFSRICMSFLRKFQIKLHLLYLSNNGLLISNPHLLLEDRANFCLPLLQGWATYGQWAKCGPWAIFMWPTRPPENKLIWMNIMCTFARVERQKPKLFLWPAVVKRLLTTALLGACSSYSLDQEVVQCEIHNPYEHHTNQTNRMHGKVENCV